jgi:hypothetical protein
MKKQTLSPRKLALKKIAIADLNDRRTANSHGADGQRSTVGHITLDITVVCTLCLD